MIFDETRIHFIAKIGDRVVTLVILMKSLNSPEGLKGNIVFK